MEFGLCRDFSGNCETIGELVKTVMNSAVVVMLGKPTCRACPLSSSGYQQILLA